ncbi:MAG: glycosyltransferase family 4 protein [Kiloniellaceae bacterium]
MKILTFTTLYPNARQPHHGIFVENRLRRIVSGGGASARVVAPVPWFPFRAKAFGRYAILAEVPVEENRFGIKIFHPRYLVIPKLGMSAAPFLLFASAQSMIRRIIRSGYDFDLIDAHYFYPDGVAAVLLGRRFRKPVAITGRGTDINLIPRHLLPRRMIRWAARNAAGLITVCQALKDALAAIGVEPGRVQVLRNGVDLELFKPVDREAVRTQLGLEPPVLLSVGHLIGPKGHDLVIRALSKLPGATLLIVGEGPEEPALKRLANRRGLNNRVRFLGSVAHERMHEIYSAADALVLASEREGWPNVLLEAMASGTPVVAANIGGTPEVVTAPAAGVLIPDRTAEAIAASVRALLASPPSRADTRAYAERFGWDETRQGTIDLFRNILDR